MPASAESSRCPAIHGWRLIGRSGEKGAAGAAERHWPVCSPSTGALGPGAPLDQGGDVGPSSGSRGPRRENDRAASAIRADAAGSFPRTSMIMVVRTLAFRRDGSRTRAQPYRSTTECKIIISAGSSLAGGVNALLAAQPTTPRGLAQRREAMRLDSRQSLLLALRTGEPQFGSRRREGCKRHGMVDNRP
jgi:hypothetical protein